jgi:hypothetical protein
VKGQKLTVTKEFKLKFYVELKFKMHQKLHFILTTLNLSCNL